MMVWSLLIYLDVSTPQYQALYDDDVYFTLYTDFDVCLCIIKKSYIDASTAAGHTSSLIGPEHPKFWSVCTLFRHFCIQLKWAWMVYLSINLAYHSFDREMM